jgi:hypothetical protein
MCVRMAVPCRRCGWSWSLPTEAHSVMPYSGAGCCQVRAGCLCLGGITDQQLGRCWIEVHRGRNSDTLLRWQHHQAADGARLAS